MRLKKGGQWLGFQETRNLNQEGSRGNPRMVVEEMPIMETASAGLEHSESESS